MGTAGVEDGQAGAGLDDVGNGMFWMLERDAACSAPPRSTAELEVAGSDAEGWREGPKSPLKVSKVSWWATALASWRI
jgi:hypothetical protein